MSTTKTISMATLAKGSDKAVARTLSALLFTIVLSGCGGTLINPTSVANATKWHLATDLNKRKGYLLYAPQVVVKIERGILCTHPGEGGACNDKPERRCVVGEPF